ncbi:glycosyltransferase family 4 protein [Mucilaginibacter jinjuensis]|uniref:Glycosyltransferase family 4 protein n=1 Tax=Mucilaginibacter jinjuensis TaxID=1176721 RepID=A0ABY7TFR0_9SPHI|nr:glycosyltransferase family 4 protein [Mucilaginibacter jinjuensis]WCT14916.1 glycosyltransferase family 4 protein [Mucilaginibacter jinjuensis]
MQKVLYVFGGEKASGAEIVLDRLMRYNKQVEPHLFISPGDYADRLINEHPYIITPSQYLKKLNRVNAGSFAFMWMALRNYLFLSAKVLRYIKKHQINIVHANTVVPASYLIPALIWSKVFSGKTKWIWSDHDINFFSKLDHVFASTNLKWYDTTLTVSNAVKNKYKDKKDQSKASVLYNGLDVDHFKPDHSIRNHFRNEHEIDPEILVFGIAGNLSVRKGQLELLESIIRIRGKKNNVYLLIAGGLTDEDRDYSDQIISLVSLHPHTAKYLGQVKDMLSFYNGCDVIVNNSNIAGSEPLGTTIYEAMACEKIVLASDTGGSKEIIDHLKNGRVFKAEDEGALDTAIQYCIDDRGNLDQLKVSAREKVIDVFNIISMADNYNGVLNHLSK